MIVRADHDCVIDRVVVTARPLHRLLSAQRAADRDRHTRDPERLQRAPLRLDHVGDGDDRKPRSPMPAVRRR